MGITVGVMARPPVPGRCKSRLAAALGEQRAASLYRAMLLDTLDALGANLAQDARLVVMAAPEDDGVAALRALAPAPWEIVPQRGQGLGARLANAVCDLFAEGDAVALVDSDSPAVDFAEVARALRRMTGPRQALLGPCGDGGYYLFALTSPEAKVFDGIEWSTPRVLEQTRARCEALGLSLTELPIGHDVDEADDLVRLRAAPGAASRSAALLGQW